MSVEKLVDKVGQKVSRRTFLSKGGAGAVGALLAIVGFPQTAYAGNYFCCNLCKLGYSSCDGFNCACLWCWTCQEGNCEYGCCECFEGPNPACSGTTCTGVVCSYGFVHSGSGCPAI